MTAGGSEAQVTDDTVSRSKDRHAAHAAACGLSKRKGLRTLCPETFLLWEDRGTVRTPPGVSAVAVQENPDSPPLPENRYVPVFKCSNDIDGCGRIMIS